MKTTIIISALVGLVGGATGSFLIGGGGGDSASHDVTAIEDYTVLKAALEKVEKDNRVLMDRLTALETRPVVETPTRIEAGAADASTTVPPEIEQLVASLRDPKERLPENFRDEITQVIADVKAAEDKKRDEERKVRDQERFDQRLAEIAKELKLNAYQAEQMNQVLSAEQAKRDEMRSKMRDNQAGPPDFDSMRTSWETLKTETTNELAKFLTNEQLSTYNDKYSNPWGGGGRGFRGGGGGNNGGGGRNSGGGNKPQSPAAGNDGK